MAELKAGTSCILIKSVRRGFASLPLFQAAVSSPSFAAISRGMIRTRH